MEKRIKDFEDYAITTEGKVISYKYKQPRIMKTWLQKSGYENIKLCKNNQTYHFLIHRLVAEAFLLNPNNLSEVDHINGVKNDNRVENLQWISSKDNINKSYLTSGLNQIRNFCECLLIKSDTQEIIDKFHSITEASVFASENFGCSKSGLMRNLKSKGYEIKKV